MKADKNTTTILDSDTESQRDLKRWRAFYEQAMKDLGFDAKNAAEYATDNLRRWWRENGRD